MDKKFIRTALLIGEENINKLRESKVCIFGIGGVGSYVLEGLVRSGIENFIIVDNDIVDETNINRQLIATEKNIGKLKVEAAKERMLEINKNVKVKTYNTFFLKDNDGIIDDSIDYIVDCIDTISAKIELAVIANKNNIPIISSMGTGNKLDPTKFEVADIYDTSVCPLAKVMRKELKKREITKLKVVYSKEEPITNKEYILLDNGESNTNKKRTPGSISFVPSVAGLIIAGEVIKDLIK